MTDLINMGLLKSRIVNHFTFADWQEIGLITGYSDYIKNHPRLLRSLNFGDEDYSGHVIAVINLINRENPKKINDILEYLNTNYPDLNTNYISSKPAIRTITFSPSVFEIPTDSIDEHLVSVMMPYSSNFDSVYTSIKTASSLAGYQCLRADDIWESSTIFQDIFSLIYKSKIVIVDFTSKNPNVMYETGIAHTLGKIVLPITQNIEDIPSDMGHHRALKYLNNDQGCQKLQQHLVEKLRSL
jgi:AbiJ N-terminal domain 5